MHVLMQYCVQENEGTVFSIMVYFYFSLKKNIGSVVTGPIFSSGGELEPSSAELICGLEAEVMSYVRATQTDCSQLPGETSFFSADLRT